MGLYSATVNPTEEVKPVTRNGAEVIKKRPRAKGKKVKKKLRKKYERTDPVSYKVTPSKNDSADK